MRIELWVPLLSFGATLLLVMTGLLNYSVFVRQLRASREQLQNARLQLEHAQQQPGRRAAELARGAGDDDLAQGSLLVRTRSAWQRP